jgi:hypothetical protein
MPVVTRSQLRKNIQLIEQQVPVKEPVSAKVLKVVNEPLKLKELKELTENEINYFPNLENLPATKIESFHINSHINWFYNMINNNSIMMMYYDKNLQKIIRLKTSKETEIPKIINPKTFMTECNRLAKNCYIEIMRLMNERMYNVSIYMPELYDLDERMYDYTVLLLNDIKLFHTYMFDCHTYIHLTKQDDLKTSNELIKTLQTTEIVLRNLLQRHV